MGSGWGSTIMITQDANRLTVEYAFFGRGDMQPPLRFVYALDGSETRNSVLMGRGRQEQVSRAAWDGDKAVITTTHAFADPASGKPMTQIVKQTLSLEGDAGGRDDQKRRARRSVIDDPNGLPQTLKV